VLVVDIWDQERICPLTWRFIQDFILYLCDCLTCRSLNNIFSLSESIKIVPHGGDSAVHAVA
jgi:hypothetical protein